MSKYYRAFKNIPPPAVAKHIADSAQGAIDATLGRKHVPHTNTVINPSSHYQSGGFHFVSGPSWNVISGPKKNGQRAFVMVQERGHQVEKFQAGGVGHHEGSANLPVPYVAPPKEVALRHDSTAPNKFKDDL